MNRLLIDVKNLVSYLESRFHFTRKYSRVQVGNDQEKALGQIYITVIHCLSDQCHFYTPPLKKVRGIMLNPPKNLRSSVRPSVRPCVCPSVSVSFPGSILSIYGPIFFKFCIGVYIRNEWFGIEDG